MTMIKKALRKSFEFIFKNHIKSRIYFAIKTHEQDYLIFINKSYSQEGEDLLIKRYFEEKKNKLFYVDVGAHHPKRFSNTYIFYTRGWRGINVDAMPDSMNLFKEIRPNDINLEVGVSDENIEELKYFIFNESALNTFSEEVAKERDGLYSYKIINAVKVPIKRIQDILEEYLPKNQRIDFMNIDVEGLDLKVLKSNNWEKYRPQVIVIESSHLLTMQEHLDAEISQFLKKKNYSFIGKTFKTLFFQDNNL